MPTTPGVMSDTEAGPLRTRITRHSGAMACEGLAPRSSRSEASRPAEQHSMAAQDGELQEHVAEAGVQSDVIRASGEQVAAASEHGERASEQGEAQGGQDTDSDSDANVRMRGGRARQLRMHDDEGETTDGSRSAASGSRASRRGSRHGMARLEAAVETAHKCEARSGGTEGDWTGTGPASGTPPGTYSGTSRLHQGAVRCVSTHVTWGSTALSRQSYGSTGRWPTMAAGPEGDRLLHQDIYT